MGEKLKKIPSRILEWWKSFDAKHKLIIGSSAVVIVVALALLVLILSSATMVELVTCETTKDASEIKSILEAEGIETEVSDDGLLVKVNEEDLSAANLALGSNGFPAAEYDLESVFSGGFSATEEDKKKRYTAYLEEKIASDLATMDVVESARVTLDIPVEDGTIISKDLDTYASVTLTLESEIDDEVAHSIAKFVATVSTT